MSTASATKTFTRWTEEERRAHRRKQNAAYQARKAENLTPREKQIKEQQRQERQATKQAMEQGAWVTTATVTVSKEVKETIKAKNGFAALESDEEEIAWVPNTMDMKLPENPETSPWRNVTKINWADSDDE